MTARLASRESRDWGSESPVFCHSFRVTWENTDTAGYIHNSVVFRYFEVGELEALRDRGVHWSVFPECGFPRVHVEADFHTPLRFDDLCVLQTRLVGVRCAGYSLAHRILRGETLAVSGLVTVCCVHAGSGRARPLPARLRRVLEGLSPAGDAQGGSA